MSPSPGNKLKVKKQESLWLMSFSDMCLVMLCFFVLMLTMMKPDLKQYEVLQQELSAKPQELTAEPTELERLSTKVKQLIADKKLQDSARIIYDAHGLEIEFRDGMSFQPGSSNPKKGFRKITNEIFGMVADLKAQYRISVEGHTDDTRVKRGSRVKSNWELSAGRGIFIMNELIRSGVNEKSLSVTAFADTKPRVEPEGLDGKELAEARVANRRVVVRIR